MYIWEKKYQEAMSVSDVVSRNLHTKSAELLLSRWRAKHEKKGYSLVGLSRACSLIALYRNREILIVGDYDVDGICSVAILKRCLERIGAKVTYRIPRPVSEGYGISKVIVSEVEDDSLVITVDNGITGLQEIKSLRDRKIDVIVLDHHLPELDSEGEAVLPEAEIVIDPNAIPESADFNGYCGAGLAYKLAGRVLDIFGVDDEEFERHLLTLACIATISDSVPLLEENYMYVSKGLEYLSTGDTFPGVNALLELFNLDGHCTETDVGYKLGPAINSDNRIYDGGQTAIGLLLEDDLEKAFALARGLKETNELRKNLVKDATALADRVVTAYHLEEDCPIFVNLGNRVKERLIGIVAGKLAEKYGYPSVVFTQGDDDIFKGSARSVEDVDIHDILLQAESLYETFGGHKAACGLTIRGKDNYQLMKAQTHEYVSMFDLKPRKSGSRFFDLEINATDVPKVIDDLRRFAPFGEGNPIPVFRITGFINQPIGGQYFKTMSYEGVKFISENNISAVGFGFTELLRNRKPKEMILYGTISENYYRGRLSPQISFEDYEIVSEY